jgi:putative transcriptional regulator
MAEYISNNIRALRQKAGWTQDELAQAVGVSRQTVIAIEKGNYTPSVLLALRLAAAFRLRVDDIFSIHGKK